MKRVFIQIDYTFLKHLIRFKGYTFKSLSEEIGVDAHVFSRAKKKGRIKKELLEKIGALFNLDITYISDSFLKNYKKYGEDMFYLTYGYKKTERSPHYAFNERILNRYPYKNRVERTQSIKTLQIALERLFYLMDIPFKAYKQLAANNQVMFLKDLNNAVYPVFKKYFNNEINNLNDFSSFDKYINSLEEYQDNKIHAEAIFNEYIKNPPADLSVDTLKSMSYQELINYDYNKHIEDEIHNLRQSFMHNPPEGYSIDDIISFTDEKILKIEAEITNKKYFSKYFD